MIIVAHIFQYIRIAIAIYGKILIAGIEGISPMELIPLGNRMLNKLLQL